MPPNTLHPTTACAAADPGARSFARALQRPAALLLALPLALGTAGAGLVETAAPAAAETSSTTLQRDAERLDRGAVAAVTDDGVFLSWRLLGHEDMATGFVVYRDGERITEQPITDSTNFLDAEGTAGSVYRLAIQRGSDQRSQVWASEEFTPWAQQHLDVPLDKPADFVDATGTTRSYRANDTMTADVDGDGQLELVVKWDPTNSQDNSRSGVTGTVYFDAYELDGTKLWRIDMGVNIRAGAHYSQPQLYDFDSDGRAELIVKTADGTIDGQGTVIGDADADWRNSEGRILEGPEYLTVFDGRSGAAIDTIDYGVPRGNVSSWGDGYGNRVDRFLSATAYLDGEHPTAVFARGYYTRATLWAVDFDGEHLTERWLFDSDDEGNAGYAGQGNHNLAVADVDGDQKDEIVYGSTTIDDDGTGLYTTGLGHGDAMHVSDFDPSRPGLEVFAVHESMSSSGNRGSTFRDAATGEVLWSVPATKDTGRGTMADIDPSSPGAEGWNVGYNAEWNSPMGSLRAASGEELGTDIPAANFVALWDGDLLSEIVDHDFDSTTRTGVPTVAKWDPATGTAVEILRAEGTFSNNDTKGNPALQADLLGDWREELVFRTEDSSALRIYTTTDVTEHRLRTLLSDPQYRLAIAWQHTGYNQPPHTSYFLGEGMQTPAAPSLRYTTAAQAAEPVLTGRG